MIRIITALILLIATQAQALTIDYERQTGHRYSSPYGWFYSYDIGLIDDVLRVDVDVRLTGYTPVASLLARWETGIESMWSTNRFAVPILFNVDWVTDSWDYSVTIANSIGRWNMLNWYTQTVGGWGDSFQEEAAAHEFGHMLSLWDEYIGGAVDPVTRLVGTGGIMHTLTGGMLDDYYDPFLDWYDSKQVTPDDGGGNETAPVPEPSTVALLFAGMVGLTVWRRRVAL